MFLNTRQKFSPSFLDKAGLLRLKLKAMRGGVWFRALHRIDRALVDLTLKVADKIRSPRLARRILEVARKLESLFESRMQRAVRELGVPLARRLSLLAQSWGNEAASSWAGDSGFVRYWAVLKLNEHSFTG